MVVSKKVVNKYSGSKNKSYFFTEFRGFCFETPRELKEDEMLEAIKNFKNSSRVSKISGVEYASMNLESWSEFYSKDSKKMSHNNESVNPKVFVRDSLVK